VAYQINTLAYNFLQMLDLQSAQLGEMESQVSHIWQTVDIHKEKVARREIGILTTNKNSNRQYKIIAPAHPERPAKYVRKPIDYSILDEIGHGVKLAAPPQQPQQITPRQKRSGGGGHYAPGQSPYAPGVASSAYGSLGNVSAGSSVAGAGPAPTTKPPTPPQAARYSSGTLSRSSKEYRTPPVVAPPQVPSNYAPNYPQSHAARKQQYGTLPHPQVQMVQPVQQQQPQPAGMHGDYGGATMPRLSSSSMRSTGSAVSAGGSSGGEPSYSMMRQQPIMQQQQLSATLGRQGQYGQMVAGRPTSSQYAPGSAGMQRPTQRPPSPPLPMPPQALHQQPQQPTYAAYNRQASTGSVGTDVYSRQTSVASSLQQMGAPDFSRQSSASSGQQQQQKLSRQSSAAQLAAAAARQLSRQSSQQEAWAPKAYMEKVTAIYDYSADKEDELSFTEGKTIYVLKKNDDGWWEGVMDGITGLFPGNYVEASV